MGERKVLNKYIPADFDPSLVPRGKKLSSKDGTVPVRMMLPFSIQCSTCNTFLYRGRKFNSKKEPVSGPNGKYLGIQRWRFYIKCVQCARPLTFTTDPENADYEMESGGTRNYEVYKHKKEVEEMTEQEKEEEEKADHMKALENRVLDSQREMADLDNLEEIKAMNRRHLALVGGNKDVSFDAQAKALLDQIEKNRSGNHLDTQIELEDDMLNEEDEKLIQSIQFGQSSNQQQQKKKKIKRLNEADEERLEAQREAEMKRMEQRQREQAAKAEQAAKPKLPVVLKKKKRKQPATTTNDADSNKKQQTTEFSATGSNGGGGGGGGGGGITSLLAGYGSDSDSD